MRRLLRKDPKSRLQLCRVKDHPWILRYAGEGAAAGAAAAAGGAAAVGGGGGGGGGGGVAPTPASHGAAARVPHGAAASAPTPAHAFSTVAAGLAPSHLFASSGIPAAGGGGGGLYGNTTAFR